MSLINLKDQKEKLERKKKEKLEKYCSSEHYQNRQKFLSELSDLTRKYGIRINACGCCDSPWIYNKESNNGQYEVTSNEIELDSYNMLTWVENELK